MRVIIAGSRDITDESLVLTAITDAILSGIVPSEIVSGCALGVDRIGARIALGANLPVKEFPAQWELYGKSAGPIRNQQMADYADALIAITNGSRGTADMIRRAKAKGLKVHVHRVDSL